MGRKPVVIDKGELQAIVTKIETELKPTNLSKLWKLVEASEWAKGRGRPFNKSTLARKAKDLGVVITTQAGKLRSDNPPTRLGIKRKKKTFSLEVIDIVQKEFAPLGPRRLAALMDGKMSAAIAAKCWDCTGHQRVEVANCGILTCPLWPHRPWRKQFESDTQSTFTVDDSAGHAGSPTDGSTSDEPHLDGGGFSSDTSLS